MRRQPAYLMIALAAALGLAAGGSAAHRPSLSWGKPGVAYETYRADATACLRAAAAVDLTGTEPAQALVLASRRVATAAAADPWSVAQAIDAARPDLSIHQARDIMQARLDHCLEEHGYRRFELTDAQRRQLAHYDLAAPARQVYLYSLASDPQVLASQAVSESATR
jgi:hypothetical protein